MISTERRLLEEPDQVAPLAASLSELLREELNGIKKQWDDQWKLGESRLEADSNWQAIEPERRRLLRLSRKLILDQAPRIEVENTEALLRTLDAASLSALRDRIAAMPSRYDGMLVEAAKLLEPAAHRVQLPNSTLRTEEEIDSWYPLKESG